MELVVVRVVVEEKSGVSGGALCERYSAYVSRLGK